MTLFFTPSSSLRISPFCTHTHNFDNPAKIILFLPTEEKITATYIRIEKSCRHSVNHHHQEICTRGNRFPFQPANTILYACWAYITAAATASSSSTNHCCKSCSNSVSVTVIIILSNAVEWVTHIHTSSVLHSLKKQDSQVLVCIVFLYSFPLQKVTLCACRCAWL